MKLSDYLRALGISAEGADPQILSVENDSRRVRPGSLFCAIPGAKTDGSKFIPDAIRAGAAALIAERKYPEYPVPSYSFPDLYRAWGILCETEAGNPANAISMHAITGTNGKTTSAMILRKIFQDVFPEEKCGLISTVLYDVCNSNPEEASRTTPDAKGFQRLLLEMKHSGCTRAVMEASSHGLHQHRTGNMKVRSAVFTNLTGDHLDYHLNMENYFQAKKILFTEMLAGNAVINKDDPWGKRLAAEVPGAIAYSGKAGAEARYTILEKTAAGTCFRLESDFGKMEIHTNLIGDYNVCNITGAALAALADGIPADKVEHCLCGGISVPGRLERFELPSGASIFVDYAHTDDALERVLSALRPLIRPGGRLICVFGCGGDRDKTKRPRMGAAAARLADIPIVTDDNPRSEEPSVIAGEIFSGMPENMKRNYISPRSEAIREAIRIAEPDDVILLAGKGHEKTQEIAGVKYPFDDRQIIQDICKL